MDFQFTLVNLREFDAGPLLASLDWADNALALLAKGEPEQALTAILDRLRAMQPEDRNWAASTLLLLSGTLGREEAVNSRLKEVGMINVMENKVLGPIIQRHLEQERSEGRSGGLQSMLQDLLSEKFGVLPSWALEKLHTASNEELSSWGRRILHPSTLEDTLR